MTDPRPAQSDVPPGQWHMYRRDHHLSGRRILTGAVIWKSQACGINIFFQRWFVRGIAMTGLKE